MLQLDFRSRTPIYEQLIEKIRELIIRGVLNADEQLPSVRELALELTVNPNTIQKAYRELERLGYTYSIQGRGSFVKPMLDLANSPQREELMKELERVIVELLYLGVKPEDIREAVQKLIDGGEKK